MIQSVSIGKILVITKYGIELQRNMKLIQMTLNLNRHAHDNLVTHTREKAESITLSEEADRTFDASQ